MWHRSPKWLEVVQPALRWLLCPSIILHSFIAELRLWYLIFSADVRYQIILDLICLLEIRHKFLDLMAVYKPDEVKVVA